MLVRMPPAKRVFVHVGVPKSGTSFIQATLRDNRARLREAGILYPSRTRGDMFRAALDANGHARYWGFSDEQVAGAWEEICARVRRFAGTSVISSEFLCTAPAERITEALRHLEGIEVHVVVTARDLARQLPAEWQEGIKHGRSVRYASFRERILDPERRHPHARRFWNAQDVPDVLARWGAALPPERVHLVTCPPPGAPPNLLWERFSSLFDLPPGTAELPGQLANTSLGVTQIEVLRHVNRSVSHRDDPRAHGRLVKRTLVRDVLRKQQSPRATAAPEDLPALQSIAKQWRQEIETRGYHVVGSLTDLEPVEPPGSMVDPDRVRPREALRASTVAIGDLLWEIDRLRAENARLRLQPAAERPIPLRARLGRLRRAALRRARRAVTVRGR
jgi:hypothetical protein